MRMGMLLAVSAMALMCAQGMANAATPDDVGERGGWRFSEVVESRSKGADGRMRRALSVRIQNLTGRFHLFLLQVEFKGEGDGWKGKATLDGLDDGEARYVTIDPLATGAVESGAFSGGKTEVILSLYEPKPPSRLLGRARLATDITFSPLSIRLTNPWYKNVIFATQPVDSVEAVVDIDLPRKALSKSRMTAEIRAGDKVVAGPVRVRRVQPQTTISIPAGNLPEGDFTLRVALTTKNGKELHAATTRLRKVPPHEGETRFDRNMACLVNGKPFIPFGWFTARESSLDLVARGGLNTAGCYGPTAIGLGDEEIERWLDKAHSLGLRAIPRPFPSLDICRTAGKGELLTKKEAAAIRALVRKWRDHPAVMAWYLRDEPELRPVPIERLLQEYKIIDEEDPWHPVVILNTAIDSMEVYEAVADVLMPDPYCSFFHGRGATCIINPSLFAAAGVKATQGQKAVWATPQGHIVQRNNSRPPTFRELRNMTWQAIAHGTTGFVWYREQFIPNLINSEVGMPRVAKEVQAVGEYVRCRSVPGMVTVVPKEAKVSCGVKRVGAHLLVIAANLAFEDKEYSFEVKGLDERPLAVLSEGRSVQPKRGEFSDRFKPYEVHVYTTDFDVNERGLKTVSEVEDEIEKAFKARQKPGNVAYLATGARATAKGDDTGAAYFVNDGTLKGRIWPMARRQSKVPAWLEVAFPKPETVGRIVLYAGGLGDFEIQVKVNGKWIPVATIANKKDDGKNHSLAPGEFTFAPRETTAIRLYITACHKKRYWVREIEAYGE